MSDTVYVLRDSRGNLAKVSGLGDLQKVHTGYPAGSTLWPFSNLVVWSATAIWAVEPDPLTLGKKLIRRLKSKNVPEDELALTESCLIHKSLSENLVEAQPSPARDSTLRMKAPGYSVIDTDGSITFRVGDVPMYLQQNLNLLKKAYLELPAVARGLLDGVLASPESSKSVVIREELLSCSEGKTVKLAPNLRHKISCNLEKRAIIRCGPPQSVKLALCLKGLT